MDVIQNLVLDNKFRIVFDIGFKHFLKISYIIEKHEFIRICLI